jgi:hypothetical protein
VPGLKPIIGIATMIKMILVTLSVATLSSGCMATTYGGYLSYKKYLASQETHEESLPQATIDRLQPHFETNLSNVRIFSKVDTVSGKVVTIGRNIYFPSQFQLDQESYLRRLLHELKHVDQQEAEGDLFLSKYLGQGIAANISNNGVFDMHADWTFEKDARAAETIVFDKLKIPCHLGICQTLR